MKKFISVLLTFILILSVCPCLSLASAKETTSVNTFEALLNPDFENGSEGWTYTSDAGEAQENTSNVYSGEKSIFINSSKTACLSQQTAVSAGDNLVLSVFCDAEKYNTNSGYSYISVEVWGNGSKLDSKTSNKRVSASAGWVQMTAELVAPQGAEYAIVKLGVSVGAQVYFDDAMLLCIPAEIAYNKTEFTPINPSENHILNPGFETFNGSKLVNWTGHYENRYGSWGTNKYSDYATDVVRTGSYSVRLQGLDGRYPEISQKIYTLEPLATYKFSVWVYSKNSTECDFFFSCVDKNGNTLDSQTSMSVDSSKRPLNKWYELTEYFTISDYENLDHIYFYIRTDAYNDIYIDDLSLYKVEESEVCSIKTDEWYYYSEWDGGTADIMVPQKILNQYPGGSAKVFVTRKNNSTKISEQSFNLSRNIKYSFKTSDLKPSYGEVFYLNAEIYDKNGKLAGSNKEYFVYYSRPENLLEDGTWLDNDGKPMEIVIGNAGNDVTIPYASKSGINLVTIGYSRDPERLLAALDLCEANGVMGIVHLYTNSNACGMYPLETIRAVEAVKDHPATFGYSVQDEPYCVANPYPGLRVSYQLIRDIDKKHPVYFVESCIPFQADQLKVADFLCIDAYCAARAPYAEYVAPYMLKLAAASKLHHNKPTAGLIQTYTWQDYYPTVDEARHMAYQVLFAGVDTSGYYHLNGILEKESFAEGFAKFNLEEIPILYKLFHTNECNLIAYDNKEASTIWYYAWKDGQKTYIAAINRDVNNQKQVQFTGLSKPVGAQKTYGTLLGSNVSFSGNNVTLQVGAGACVMFEYSGSIFPYEERFNINEYTEVTDALLEANDGQKYENTFHVPTGWDWLCTIGAGGTPHGAADASDSARRRAQIVLADGEAYLRKTGSDMVLTKMVDIDPGYSYTLTSTATAKTTNTTARSALTYWLYHKNDDGTYTEINEYLKSIGKPELSKTTETDFFNASNATNKTVSFDGTENAVQAELSLSFSASNSYINAVRVGLGGYGGGGNHYNFSVYHKGFELDKTNFTSLIVSEEKFTANYVEKEATLEGVWQSQPVSYTATHKLPSNLWNVEKIEQYNNKDYQISAYAEKSSVVSLSETSNGKEPFYSFPGSIMTMTKMIDIEPGYEYTLNIDATTYGGYIASGQVYLYHKNDDGTYTPINEYLTENCYQNTLSQTRFHAENKETTTLSKRWNDGFYDKPVSITFKADDASVNAIKIAMGGISSNEQSVSWSSYYFGYSLTKNKEVEIVPNLPPSVYNSEVFTANGVQKEATLEGVYQNQPVSYTATHTVPSNLWNVERIDMYAKDYQITSYKEKGSVIGVSETSNGKEPFYYIDGSIMLMTKMVDIEPGYTYILDIDAVTYGGYIASGQVWLYHKNEDGTYTPINDYLADNNFDNTLETVKFNAENKSADTVSKRWNGGFYEKPVRITFKVTDPSVNAIKIGMGGYASSEQSVNWSAYYFGYKLLQGPKAEIVSNNQNTESKLILSASGDTPIVKYMPKEAGETPSIVIAFYEKNADGTLRLCKTDISKPKANGKGHYEAEYTAPADKTLTVKAFVWDMGKAKPLANSLIIQ